VIFTEQQFSSLKNEVSTLMSEKRFRHTVRVSAAAEKLARYCAPELVAEAKIAALLHDVTKELPHEEQLKLLREGEVVLDAEDYESPAVLHSFTAPVFIKRRFPEWASPIVLGAVKNHTVGSPDMSVFDEIVFLSDYIEDGRTYDSCAKVRWFVWSSMADDIDNNLKILHKACVSAIDNTIFTLISRKKTINTKNILTRNALLSKILHI
jgi:predicted HD superfamily hydrolase involved in NAD metabolism